MDFWQVAIVAWGLGAVGWIIAVGTGHPAACLVAPIPCDWEEYDNAYDAAADDLGFVDWPTPASEEV